MSNYDIKLDQMRVEDNPSTRDNIVAIERSLREIEIIIQDINARLDDITTRLKALEP